MCGSFFFVLYVLFFGGRALFYYLFDLLYRLVSLVFGPADWVLWLAVILTALLALLAAIGIAKYVRWS